MEEIRMLKKGDRLIIRTAADQRDHGYVDCILADGKVVEELPWNQVGGLHVAILFTNKIWAYGDDVWEDKRA